MKPPPFRYHRPASREEVDAILHRMGDGARVLAGGQSLIPMMNMRLAWPTDLVDVNFLREEATEPAIDDEGIVVGPLLRVSALERSRAVRTAQPLLPETARLIAHAAIRNRATVAGSIAHADPAAELPAVLVLLGGSVRARGAGGVRTIEAPDLYLGPFETSLRDGEWIDEVRFPLLPRGDGVSVAEFSRRRGDFALCGVAGSARSVGRDRLEVKLCYFAVNPHPTVVSLPPVETTRVSAAWIGEAVGAAAAEALEPHDDMHATADFRMHLAERLGARVAGEALARLRETAPGRGTHGAHA